jgi:hypothetical protein
LNHEAFQSIAREYEPPDNFEQSPKQRGAHFDPAQEAVYAILKPYRIGRVR